MRELPLWRVGEEIEPIMEETEDQRQQADSQGPDRGRLSRILRSIGDRLSVIGQRIKAASLLKKRSY